MTSDSNRVNNRSLFSYSGGECVALLFHVLHKSSSLLLKTRVIISVSINPSSSCLQISDNNPGLRTVDRSISH